MKKKVSKPKKVVGPSLKPQSINKNAWYYEYPSKIEVYQWITTIDGKRICESLTIPWNKLEKSIARCRGNKKKKK